MDYLRFHSYIHPNRLAITDLTFDRKWTYQQFDRLVAGCVAVLVEKKVGEGDRVACLSTNRAEIIVLHLACARIGAIFVPLNWRLSPSELQLVIQDCAPSFIYGDALVDELDIVAQDIEQLLDQCNSAQPSWPEQKSVDLPSLMLYTSGTTGKPKGVLLSERNLTETAINFASLGEVENNSRFLCESPMFHIIGMVTSIRPPILLGAQVAVSDRFIPERTFSRLADPDLEISHYFCVPQMAVAIRNVDGFDAAKLRGLRAIFTGGAPHPESQIRVWLNDGIVIVDGFGMSEAGTVFGMPLDLDLIDQKAGSVGIGTPRIQARLVDGDGNVVPSGVSGELQLRGDNISVGYWCRDEDYKNAFTKDGWFQTGDILVNDQDGYYRVTDRKKDMYITGGENVYPVEIEAQLVNYPGIRDFAVIGVPDSKWGEVGCLYYVPESGEIDLGDVETFLTDRLARYKIPKKIRVVSELPRTALGKLMRHELRKRYSASLDKTDKAN